MEADNCKAYPSLVIKMTTFKQVGSYISETMALQLYKAPILQIRGYNDTL